MSEGGQINVELLISNADQFKQQIGTASQSLNQLKSSVDPLKQGMSSLDQSLTTSGQKTGALKQSTDQLGQSMKSTTPTISSQSKETQTLAANADKASGSNTKLAQTTKQVDTASSTAVSSHRNLGVAFAGIATSALGVVTQITSLGNQYDNLNDAQLRIQKGATGIKVATTAVEKAERSLLDVMENEKSTDEDVAIAQDNLANAKEKLNNKIDVQSNLVEDTNRAWKQFGLQIAGTVLQSVGGIATAFGAMGPAAKVAGAGMGEAGKGASGLLKTLGPIAIAIGAASAAFLAIKNNTFGFRDALSNLGVQLGTALPILTPLLDFFKQLGGFLGIAGDESATLKEKFIQNLTSLKDQAVAMFQNLITGVQTFIGGFLKAFDLLGQGNIGGAFEQIKTTILDAFNGILNVEQLRAWADTIIQWVSSPTNWVDLGRGIIDAFNSAIQWTSDDLLPMLQQFVQAIADWVTEPQNWIDMWNGLVEGWIGIVEWVEENIWKWIEPFITALIDWVTNPDNWADVWDAIVEGFMGIVEWTEENIVPLVEGFVKAIQDWAGKPENWEALWDDIQKAWAGAVEWVDEFLGPIWDGFLKWATDTFGNAESWKTWGTKVVNAMLDAIDWLGGNIDTIATDLFSALKTSLESIDAFETGKAIVKAIADAIKSVLTNAESFFGGIWDTIVNFITGGLAGGGEGGSHKVFNEAPLNGAATKSMTMLAELMKTAVGQLGSLWSGIVTEIGAQIDTAVGGFDWSTIGTAIGNAIGGAIVWTSDQVGTVLTDLFKAFNSVVPNSADAFDIGDKVGHAILDAIRTAIDTLADAFGALYAVIIEKIFPTGGGAGGAVQNEAPIVSAVKEILEAIKNAMIAEAAFIGGIGFAFLEELAKSFTTFDWAAAGKSLADAIVASIVWTGVTLDTIFANFFTELNKLVPNEADAFQAGKNLVAAIVGAIKSAITAAAGALAELYDWIVKGIFGEGGEGGLVQNEAPVSNAANALLALLDKSIRALGAFLGGIGIAICEGIAKGITDTDWKAVGNTIVTAIRDGVIAVGNLMIDAGKAFYVWIHDGIFKTDWQQVGKDLVDAIIKGVQAVANTLVDALKAPFETFWDWLLQLGKDIQDKIAELMGLRVEKAAENIGTNMSRILETRAAAELAVAGKEFHPESVQQEPLAPAAPKPAEKPWYQFWSGGQQQAEVIPAALSTQAQSGASGIQDLTLQMGAFQEVMNLVIAKIQEIIPWFTTLQTALQANTQVWIAYGEGINTMIQSIAQLIVAFCQQSVAPNITLISTALQANSSVWVAYGEGINTAIQAIASLVVAFAQQSVAPNITLISTALQANAQVWISYGEGINTMIQSIAKLIVAFCNESVIANILLIDTALQANSTVWQAWAGGINTILQPLAQLIVAFVNETVNANLATMQEALQTNATDGWQAWATVVGEAIVLIGEGLAQFFDDVFTTWHEGIIESLEEQTQAWEDYAQGILDALTDAGNSLYEFAEAVVELRDGVIDSCAEMIKAFGELAKGIDQAVKDGVNALDDFVKALEDTVSALEDVTSAAEDTAQAVEDIPDEKVIHVSYDVEDKPSGLRRGGAFMKRKNVPLGFQHGGAYISTSATTIGGHRISEFDKWELVTVTPLSNPNDVNDKNSVINEHYNVGSPYNEENVAAAAGNVRPGALAGILPSTRSTGGSRTIIVKGAINSNVYLEDGRLLAKATNPYIMEGQDAEY